MIAEVLTSLFNRVSILDSKGWDRGSISECYKPVEYVVITAALGGSEQFYVNANVVLVPFLHSGSINSHCAPCVYNQWCARQVARIPC